MTHVSKSDRSRGSLWIALGLAVAFALSGLLLVRTPTGGHGIAPGLLVAAAIVAANLVGLVVSEWARIDYIFDLLGSLSFIVAIGLAVGIAPNLDATSALIGLAVAVWALRLGAFLFFRSMRRGDRRLQKAGQTRMGRARLWLTQSAWVLAVLAPAVAAILETERQRRYPMVSVGLIIWLAGFLVEALADDQKRRFNQAQIENQTRTFISSGLWSRSRHPNYFGEILVWVGLAIASAACLGASWFASIGSPLFIWLLLIFVSGVPILERRSNREWGGTPAYEAYKSRTKLLSPVRPAIPRTDSGHQ